MEDLNIWIYILAIVGFLISKVIKIFKQGNSETQPAQQQEEPRQMGWEEIFGQWEDAKQEVRKPDPVATPVVAVRNSAPRLFVADNPVTDKAFSMDPSINDAYGDGNRFDAFGNPDDLRRAVITHEILKRKF